ncbi:MAG: Tm-1-like ATP-binding domain-containing protein [Anaerolineales bacterium]|nr:Tm-1-like ATP-binding domain-containing protein [Anaerolineales bacterium]
MRSVYIIGTLDTKGAEIGYLRDRLKALGLATTVVDSGILDEPLGIELDPAHDITRYEAAAYGGFTLEQLRAAGSRGRAVAGMRTALQKLILEHYRAGKVAGVTSMGGAEGAVMGAATMMQLPLGVPKVLVSPIASGKHFLTRWSAPATSSSCTPSWISWA